MFNYSTHKLFFDGKEYNILGASRSAIRTGFYIKELDICLDAGLLFEKKPKNILITHGHIDHINNLYSLLLDNKHKPNIFLPSSSINLVRTFLNSIHSVTLNKKSYFNKYQFIDIEDNYNQYIEKRLKFTCYQLDHRIDCLAYGLTFIDSKLNPIYKDLDKEQLIKIKNEGKELSIKNEKHFLLFCGDMSNESLKTLPFNKYKYIFIECTFLDDTHYYLSYDKKHLHWNDLQPYIELNKESNFYLMHFSKRYDENYIREFFKDKPVNIII